MQGAHPALVQHVSQSSIRRRQQRQQPQRVLQQREEPLQAQAAAEVPNDLSRRAQAGERGLLHLRHRAQHLQDVHNGRHGLHRLRGVARLGFRLQPAQAAAKRAAQRRQPAVLTELHRVHNRANGVEGDGERARDKMGPLRCQQAAVRGEVELLQQQRVARVLFALKLLEIARIEDHVRVQHQRQTLRHLCRGVGLQPARQHRVRQLNLLDGKYMQYILYILLYINIYYIYYYIYILRQVYST
eukprot:COSAG05_NODE_1952_length_3792_cov_7.187111_7_plen_243_part_00